MRRTSTFWLIAGSLGLALIANEGGQLALHELSIHAFDPTGLKRLEVFDGAQPDGQDQILYVPRESV